MAKMKKNGVMAEKYCSTKLEKNLVSGGRTEVRTGICGISFHTVVFFYPLLALVSPVPREAQPHGATVAAGHMGPSP